MVGYRCTQGDLAPLGSKLISGAFRGGLPSLCSELISGVILDSVTGTFKGGNR